MTSVYPTTPGRHAQGSLRASQRALCVLALTAMVATSALHAAAAPTPASKGAAAQHGKSQQPTPATGPHVEGSHTVKTYKYENAIRESVRVFLDTDHDGDGAKDTAVVDIVRPREAAEQGIKVPVIALPSPYYTSRGRGVEHEKKTYDADGINNHSPLFYDNYFVEYGYAVATIDVAGTARATGCGDVGGKAEIQSVTRVIDWLNGRAKGHYLAGGNGPAIANWSTGNVGLIGKSWDGTLSNGAASTGVEGLRTVVPISGISSWYDYYRYMGIRTRPDKLDWLAKFVGNDLQRCDVFHKGIGRATDTLEMNAAWQARDYVKDAAKVKASVLIAHGQNDDNVNMRHAGEWFKALRANNVSTALWLSQAEHTDPFDVDRKNWVAYLHKWFDFWLMGLSNDVMSRQSTVEHEIGTFAADATWPIGAQTTIPVGKSGLGSPASPFTFPIVTPTTSQADAVTDPSEPRGNRHVFLSNALSKDVRISGVPTVKVRVRTNGSTLPLTARLVDYGDANRYEENKGSGMRECWGGQTATDTSCYLPQANVGKVTDTGVIARGWMNAAFRDGLSSAKPIPQGKWMDVTIPMMMTDNVVKAGHRLALVLSLGDVDLFLNGEAPAEFDSAGISVTAHIDRPEEITPSRENLAHTSVRSLGKQAPREVRIAKDASELR